MMENRFHSPEEPEEENDGSFELMSDDGNRNRALDEIALRIALEKNMSFDQANNLIDLDLCASFVQDNTRFEIAQTGGLNLNPLFSEDISIVLFDLSKDSDSSIVDTDAYPEMPIDETPVEYHWPNNSKH